MKVFRCAPDSIGGRVIVAANSAEEAKKTISSYIYWQMLYKEENFREIENLEYKGTTPTVIYEHHDDYESCSNEPENKNVKVEWSSTSLKIELV